MVGSFTRDVSRHLIQLIPEWLVMILFGIMCCASFFILATILRAIYLNKQRMGRASKPLMRPMSIGQTIIHSRYDLVRYFKATLYISLCLFLIVVGTWSINDYLSGSYDSPVKKSGSDSSALERVRKLVQDEQTIKEAAIDGDQQKFDRLCKNFIQKWKGYTVLPYCKED